MEHFRATEKPELAGQTELVELASDAGASQLRRRLLVATAIAGAAIVLAFAIWKAWPNDRQLVAAPMLTVFPATTFRGRETNPNFSPDGSQIAFAWDAGDGGDFDIYVKVVGENRAVRLTSDRRPEFSPVWSPDGRWSTILVSRNPLSKHSLSLVPRWTFAGSGSTDSQGLTQHGGGVVGGPP